MTAPTNKPADVFDRPCIAASPLLDKDRFAVAEYDAVQRQRDFQPLWARRAPPVEHLTREPAAWDVHITDQEAYGAQMWALIGLPELAVRRLGGVR
jgi:hypothetical protein